LTEKKTKFYFAGYTLLTASFPYQVVTAQPS